MLLWVDKDTRALAMKSWVRASDNNPLTTKASSTGERLLSAVDLDGLQSV